jgi:hypothetical protein
MISILKNILQNAIERHFFVSEGLGFKSLSGARLRQRFLFVFLRTNSTANEGMTSSLHMVARLLFIVPTCMWFEILRAMLNSVEMIKELKKLLVA